MDSRELLRRQLDARLQSIPRDPSPREGWIHTVRQALGMTMAQLGKRLGISAPGVAELETRESRGAISLAKLRAAADALGCDVIIAFVPRIPLEQMVRKQATTKALEERRQLTHTMRLENQDEGVAQSEDIAQATERWMAKRAARIWD